MADPVTGPGLGVPERAGAVHELCPVWAPYQVADDEELQTTQQVPSDERSARVTLLVPSELEPVATLTVVGPADGPDTNATDGSEADNVAASTEAKPPAPADASCAAWSPVESDCWASSASAMATPGFPAAPEAAEPDGLEPEPKVAPRSSAVSNADRDQAQHGRDHREAALVSGATGAPGLPPALDHAPTLLPAVRRPSPVPSEPIARLVVAM